MYQTTPNPFLLPTNELELLIRAKCKDTKVRDRVVLIEKSGSIPAGARGRVVEVMPYHEWTNPKGLRRAVRFDEYPHDYVIENQALRAEPVLPNRSRDSKGRFVSED